MFQPVYSLFILLLFLSCSQPPGTQNTILVPEQYSGYIMVFSAESCGEPSLMVPSDGTLITSTELPLTDNARQISWATSGPGNSPLPLYKQGIAGRSIFITESGAGEGLGMNYTYLRAFVGTEEQIRSAFEKSRAAEGKAAALQKLENCRRTLQH